MESDILADNYSLDELLTTLSLELRVKECVRFVQKFLLHRWKRREKFAAKIQVMTEKSYHFNLFCGFVKLQKGFNHTFVAKQLFKLKLTFELLLE